MALSHDGYNFESITDHTDLVSGTPAQLPIVPGQFFGVKGEAHLIGETYGQDLYCTALLFGYNTAALLKAAVKRIRDKQGKLTGTLTVSGNLAQSHAQCTFLEVIEPEPGAQYDGSGQHDWRQRIVLKWRRRR
jgi:hypothetical protein